MRALLVYNPNATTTTPAVTDVIARALGDVVKLDVHPTKRRHHASFLAAGAVHEGYDVVIALGGDGTVNEVLQGLVGTPVRLAVIPGGSTNVWARSLGFPRDAIEATHTLIGKLASGAERVVPVGQANDRYFCFNVGFGFDAAVVRLVEQRYRLKQTVRQASFIYCGFLAVAKGATRKAPDLTVQVPGKEPVGGLKSFVCCNTDPFTYLGPWKARLCPHADLDLGLDGTGLTSIRLPRLLRLLPAALRESGDVRVLKTTRTWHDEPAYDVFASAPLPYQVDGDYVGETDQLRIRLRRDALKIVA